MSSRRLAVVSLVALGVSFAAGCGKSDDAAPGGPTTPDASAPVCDPAVTRLGDLDLGTGFFGDDYAALGLEAARGRRVTFADVNGDGRPDFIAIETGVAPGLQHLWINTLGADGKTTFVETTAASGILTSRTPGVQQTALMVTFADVDNDGDLDLFQGSYSQASTGTKYVPTPNELYLNDGHGVFTLKADSGVNLPWPLTTSSAVFFDADKDGKLDLYIGAFMINYPDETSYQDELYKGNGDGTFTRVTAAAGLETKDALGAASGSFPKPTYGATACDINNDGWQDLLVSSYALCLDDLWQNKGDGTFTNVSKATKFAQDDQPNPAEDAWRQGGNTFAAACADYDNDGDLDVFNAETTHSDAPRSSADRSRILRNTGAEGGYTFERPTFAETGINRDIDKQEKGNEGDHGASWFDFDNDGLLDLIIEQSAYPGNHAYIYHQRPDHTFEDVTAASGMLAAMSMSNGLSVDDIDGDGALDIIMGSVDANGVKPPGGVEHVHIYVNKIGSKQSFLHVTLKGVKSNALGIGARVTLTAGCITQTREIVGGRGTFGATDPAYAHFGLGNVTKIDKLTVQWPTNPPTTQEFKDVPVNKFVKVTEGAMTPELKDPVKR
jgi:enediyne biosynthesis protein E4